MDQNKDEMKNRIILDKIGNYNLTATGKGSKSGQANDKF